MFSFYEFFRRRALERPGKTALVIEDKTYTYGELLKLTDKLGDKLGNITEGGKKNIATFLGNKLELVLLLLVASKLGITLVPLPPELPPEFRKKLLSTCDVDFAITTENLKGDVAKDVETFTVEEILELPLQGKIPTAEPNLDKPYIITTTSGSTGNPKPIVLTQRVKLLRAFEGGVKVFNLSGEDVYIVSTPLYHSLAQRFTLLPLITGATAVVMKKFHPTRWLELVEKHKVSFGVLVSSQLGTIISTLLEEKGFNPSPLRKLISSSAPLLEKTRKEALDLAKKFGWDIYETYGTSEIGFASVLNMTKETEKWNSVGKLLPYVKVKILCDDKNECPFGEVGEIAVKTPTRFAGYYKMEEKTKESFTEDGYFLTGDLGYLDSDGYLYFAGRKKEVIITGGINVYPQDVEKVILSYPGIKECAVFGVENDRLGEIVCALIVPEKGGELNLPHFKGYLRKHLTGYQMPQYIKVVKEIPKNHLGKIVRRDLKAFIDKNKLEKLTKILNLLR